MALGSSETGGISASNGGMILLVEDDDRISRLERFVLEQVGYRVACVGSGEEALEMLPNTTPSLVILDAMLPRMDGFTTCQRIRESSQVPIIMVTAMDRDEDKVRGLEMGADDYITKPFSTHELASRVRSVLRRTKSNRTQRPAIVTTTAKTDMSFLHPRDETLAYPTQAPILGSVHLSSDPTGLAKKNPIGPPPASTTTPVNQVNYEGPVRLAVTTTGSIKAMIRFVEVLRENRQIHLLRMVSNQQRDGMDVWLRLRSPNPLKNTLLAASGVTSVDVGESTEAEPNTPVLNVALS